MELCEEEFEPWPEIAGGLENFGACDRRDEVVGRISAGGASESLWEEACEFRCEGKELDVE